MAAVSFVAARSGAGVWLVCGGTCSAGCTWACAERAGCGGAGTAARAVVAAGFDGVGAGVCATGVGRGGGGGTVRAAGVERGGGVVCAAGTRRGAGAISAAGSGLARRSNGGTDCTDCGNALSPIDVKRAGKTDATFRALHKRRDCTSASASTRSDPERDLRDSCGDTSVESLPQPRDCRFDARRGRRAHARKLDQRRIVELALANDEHARARGRVPDAEVRRDFRRELLECRVQRLLRRLVGRRDV